LAQEYGAAGVLIYSDPGDDGIKKGTPFPKGPWRPQSGVQRGSIWVGNGDPLTPGWASTDTAPRLTVDQARQNNNTQGFALPKIPIQPISWGDAEFLLRNLSGPEAPADWQGGINMTYYIGPGPSQVNMTIKANFSTVTPIWNVIGKIQGFLEPDRYVILGNHRDAWVFGAVDPSSGTSVLLEVARAINEQIKYGGWRPRRSIMFCSWDAEEYGLIGSTEFGEGYKKILQSQAVAYINLDSAVSGTDQPGFRASPNMADVARQITQLVDWPGQKKSLRSMGTNKSFRCEWKPKNKYFRFRFRFYVFSATFRYFKLRF